MHMEDCGDISEHDQDASQQTMHGKKRSKRFVDQNGEDIRRSENLNDLKPFYSGENEVNERMNDVRKWIVHIRENWYKYAQFMETLKGFLLENYNYDSPDLTEDDLQALFSCTKNWVDLIKDEDKSKRVNPEKDFNIIRLFTTVGGRELFKKIRDIFRNDTVEDDEIKAAVFFVELMNIDLFNLCSYEQTKNDFQGIVYRGVTFDEKDFQLITKLMQEPVEKRYVSIPLSLWSSSRSRRKAEKFLTNELQRNTNHHPLLMQIRVLGLDPGLLKFYRKKYKERSVVSTICAVDISDVSEMPDEQEVLLRGASLQAINLSDGDFIGGKKSKVLELVMVNSNRDHMSTSTMLGADSDEARKMFGTMVGVTRNKYIVEYCQEHGLDQDEAEYKKLHREGMEKLAEMGVGKRSRCSVM